MRYALSSFLIGLSLAGQGVALEGSVATYVVAPEIEGCIEGWELPVRVSLEPTLLESLGRYAISKEDAEVFEKARIEWLSAIEQRAEPETEEDEKYYIIERRGTKVTRIEVPPPARVEEKLLSRAERPEPELPSVEIDESLVALSDSIEEMWAFMETVPLELSLVMSICSSPMAARLVEGTWILTSESDRYELYREGHVQAGGADEVSADGFSIELSNDPYKTTSFRITASEFSLNDREADGKSVPVTVDFAGTLPTIAAENGFSLEGLDYLGTNPIELFEGWDIRENHSRFMTMRSASSEVLDGERKMRPHMGRYVLLDSGTGGCEPEFEVPFLARVDGYNVSEIVTNSRDIRNDNERRRYNDVWRDMVISANAEFSGCFGYNNLRITESAIELHGGNDGYKIDSLTQWQGQHSDASFQQVYAQDYRWWINKLSERRDDDRPPVEDNVPLLINHLTGLSISVFDRTRPELALPRPVDLDIAFGLAPDTSLTPQLLQEVTQ